jgi:hypothetical protein
VQHTQQHLLACPRGAGGQGEGQAPFHPACGQHDMLQLPTPSLPGPSVKYIMNSRRLPASSHQFIVGGCWLGLPAQRADLTCVSALLRA